MRIIAILLFVSLFIYSCKRTGDYQENQQIVVLTFDDAVKSHINYVAPLLKEFGFGATFFVSARWMSDSTNFMNWEDIGELHRMGFEVGNHSWSHLDYSLPQNLAKLEGELGLVDLNLQWQGVPKPVSFAYCGNWFAPQTVEKLSNLGYKFARRGMQPEVEYGKIVPGVLYDPKSHHPLLIPSAGDAYPDWNLDHFKEIVNRSGNSKIAVLQFHGVPDSAHQWVTTDPDLFRKCMEYLQEQNFRVIALRDLEQYLPDKLPDDPMLTYTHTSSEEKMGKLPGEMEATRESLSFWAQNMFLDHDYSIEEAQLVTGLKTDTLQGIRKSIAQTNLRSNEKSKIKIRPYPGGRHPRIGFLDGALDPLRGTKFSVFLPDNPHQYVVVDLPEAIFSNLGLTFLAHRHIPTVWDYQHTLIENTDWQVNHDGSLENSWTLPNKISFGARAVTNAQAVTMELWLYNGTGHRLDSLKTQVCVMLKGAHDYNDLTNQNKKFARNTAAVKSGNSNKWILTSWERTFNPWGNADVPCMHTDPMFKACQPGDTVRLQGKLWFYEGTDVEQYLNL